MAPLVGDARFVLAASRFVSPQDRMGAGQPTTMTSSYDSPNSMQQVFYNKKKLELSIGLSLSPLSLSLSLSLSRCVSLALQCGNMAMLSSKLKHTSSTRTTAFLYRQQATRSKAILTFR